MNTCEILSVWGKWQRSELNHLKYSRVHLPNAKACNDSLAMTDDELLDVDKTMAQLKQINATLFNVIKWRFVYGDSYRTITRKLHKRSAKVAGRYLDEALSLFDRVQKEGA